MVFLLSVHSIMRLRVANNDLHNLRGKLPIAKKLTRISRVRLMQLDPAPKSRRHSGPSVQMSNDVTWMARRKTARTYFWTRPLFLVPNLLSKIFFALLR